MRIHAALILDGLCAAVAAGPACMRASAADARAPREYHVSVRGDDSADGSEARMLRTISAAARLAKTPSLRFSNVQSPTSAGSFFDSPGAMPASVAISSAVKARLKTRTRAISPRNRLWPLLSAPIRRGSRFETMAGN